METVKEKLAKPIKDITNKAKTKAYNQLAQERTEVIWMNFEHKGHQIDIEEVMTWKQ